MRIKTRVAGVLAAAAAAVVLFGFSNAGCQGGAAVINDSGNTTSGDGFDFGGF